MDRARDREEVVGKLKRFFAHHPGVRLVYLFGSVARGRQMEESDADVAVLFDEGYTYEAVVSLNGALSDLLRREVDLVVLNDCNPLVAKSATQGILVWSRSGVEPLYFRAWADREAHDWAAFIDSYLALWESKGGTGEHGVAPQP